MRTTWASWAGAMACCGALVAADPMAEAQRLFGAGRPAEAASLLGKEARAGRLGPDGWFNLGQAHSAAGEPGKALWAWRQGLRGAPRDGGLRGWVGQARQRTGGTGEHPLSQWLGGLRLEEWACGLMASTVALAGWLAVGWKRGGRMARGWGWVAGVQGMLALGWWLAWMGQRWSPDAVVVAREAAVVVAPVEAAKTVRTLPEGMEVRELRRFGEWSEVELDGTRAGWLRTSQLWRDMP